jgi:hypothetical protein
MSRRTLQNTERFLQARSKGRDRDLAMGVLIPHVTVKGDGTAFRGGRHPEATMHGTAGQVCTLPRRKPFNLCKGI